MKRMIIGGILVGFAFFLLFLSAFVGTSAPAGSMALTVLILVGLILFYRGKEARGKGEN